MKAEQTEETPVLSLEEPAKEGKAEETSQAAPVAEKAEVAEKVEIANPPAVKPKAEIAEKSVVMDMSFLFGEVKSTPKAEQKPVAVASAPKAEQKPAQRRFAMPKTYARFGNLHRKQPRRTRNCLRHT